MEDRVIKTSVSNEDRYIIERTLGQMSDGIWENSPIVERFWKFVDVAEGDDGYCEVTVSSDQIFNGVRNDAWKKSDQDVLKYIAKKLKETVKTYLMDVDGESKSGWKRDNYDHCEYLGECTIADAYYVYDRLMGRKIK